jgi:hypothetical protein
MYAQWAVSSTLNLQAEVSKRNTDYGDIAMHFDPDDFDPTLRRSLDAKTARVGLRFSPNQNSTFLLSAIHTDRDGSGYQEPELQFIIPPPLPFLPPITLNVDGVFKGKNDEDVNQFDAAYIFQQETYNVTIGAAYADSDRKDTFTTSIPSLPAVPVTTQVSETDLDDTRVYAYANVKPFDGVVATIGLSYHDYDQTNLDFDAINPKVGLRFDATDDLTLRMAYFKVVKPALSSNRTLETTQVAGFNQFFDDANGSKSKRYGLGLDWEANSALRFGGEVTRRKIDWPISPLGKDAFFEGRDEWSHRAYGYWAPMDRLAVDLSLVYDKFESPGSDIRPTQVRTYSVPLSARYFHPRGFFAGITATYVDQKVEADSSTYIYETGDSSFTLVDLAVGYRFPKRSGILSLSVHNLFDKEFDYLDDSYRTFQDEPSISPYRPEQMIQAQVTISF